MADEAPHPDAAAIDTIFSAALQRAPAERAAYVAAACGSDAVLRQRVEALLDAHERAPNFLPDEPQTALAPEPPAEVQPGDRIGRYKLLQPIGEGGCGTVYMAEQEEPVRRKVALKVIKAGMDTRSVVARFEAERQALALMDHPNIAKFYDAGVVGGDTGGGPAAGASAEFQISDISDLKSQIQRGRPYFVMELVRGIRITDFCEQHQLSTRQRLDLFIQVCHAVQHAHQKGIIHRDLKPSNILVTESNLSPAGVPKIIDFGIAKATEQKLTDKTLFTQFAAFIGTPAYMSPEQAAMTSLDIDTRSDIYSLGVLLYELLTGKTPFDSQELLKLGLDEMRRVIRETEPVKPSTRLTQESLAANAGLRPPGAAPSRRYAKTPLAPATIPGDLDWIAMKCLEKDRARRYETATGLAADLQRHLNNEPVLARPPSAVYRFQKLVRRNRLAFASAAAVGLALLSGLAASTWQAIRATQAEKFAEAARRTESQQRQRAEANEQRAIIEAAKSRKVSEFLQDMLRGARPAVTQGRDTTVLREILDQTVARMDRELAGQPEVAVELRIAIGGTYVQLAEYEKAEAMLNEALRLARQVHGPQHEKVAHALFILATLYQARGNDKTAEALLQDSAVMRRKCVGEDDQLAAVLDPLSLLLAKRGQFDEAEKLCREASAIGGKVPATVNPEAADYGRRTLPAILRLRGRTLEAESLLREELVRRRRSATHSPLGLANQLSELGFVQGDRNDFAASQESLREAAGLYRTVYGPHHPYLAAGLQNLAGALKRQGRWDEAVAAQEEARSILQQALGQSHRRVAESWHELGQLLIERGDFARAEVALRQALDLRRPITGELTDDFVATLEELRRVYWLAADSEGGLEICRDALPWAERHRTSKPERWEKLMVALATFQQWRGDHPAAISAFNELFQARRQRLPATNALVSEAAGWLACALNNAAWQACARPADGAPPVARTPALTNQVVAWVRQAERLCREGLDGPAGEPATESLERRRFRFGLAGALVMRTCVEPSVSSAPQHAWLVEAEKLLNGLEQPAGDVRPWREQADLLDWRGRLSETWAALEPNSGQATNARRWRIAHVRFLSEAALDRLNRQRSVEAESWAREALPLGRRVPTNAPVRLEDCLNNLAAALYTQGRFAEAEPLYRESLANCRARAKQSDETLQTTTDLARLLTEWALQESLENHGLSGRWLEKSFYSQKKAPPASARSALSVLPGRSALERAREAEQLLRDALAAHAQGKGTNNWVVAYARNGLGAALLARAAAEPALALDARLAGFAQAEQEMLQANEIRIRRHPPFTHPDETALLRLVRLYEVWSAFAPGTNAAAQLARWKRELVGFHADLCQRLLSIRRLDKAESHARRALDISRDVDADRPEALEERLYDLANVLYRQGRHAHAEPLYRERLSSTRARLPADHAAVLTASASLARLLSDWVLLETLNSPSLSERTNLEPDDEADSSANLQTPPGAQKAAARRLTLADRAREGEQLLRDCLARRMRTLSATNWFLPDTKSRLGMAVAVVVASDDSLSPAVQQAKFSEAEAFLHDGWSKLEAYTKPDPAYKRDALVRLLRFYRLWEKLTPGLGKASQAEEWKREIANFDKKIAAQKNRDDPES